MNRPLNTILNPIVNQIMNAKLNPILNLILNRILNPILNWILNPILSPILTPHPEFRVDSPTVYTACWIGRHFIHWWKYDKTSFDDRIPLRFYQFWASTFRVYIASKIRTTKVKTTSIMKPFPNPQMFDNMSGLCIKSGFSFTNIGWI